jgi:hypothetical protein
MRRKRISQSTDNRSGVGRDVGPIEGISVVVSPTLGLVDGNTVVSTGTEVTSPSMSVPVGFLVGSGVGCDVGPIEGSSVVGTSVGFADGDSVETTGADVTGPFNP